MQTRGFTLIELMVSVTIFIVVMTISLGALLAMSASDRKAEAVKTIMNNLSFGLESMTRSIRTGFNYSCGAGAGVDCAGGALQIAFDPAGGGELAQNRVQYRLENSSTSLCEQPAGAVGCLVRSTGGGTEYPVTAPEIRIIDAKFYVNGTVPGDDIQPRVIITLRGEVDTGDAANTEFRLQTMVTQRLYDQ